MLKQVLQVASFGEVLWDMYPHDQKLGGAPANFAYYCSQLGAKSSLISSVGRDPLGRKTLTQLACQGIHADHVQVHPLLPTGTCHVALNNHGEARFSLAERVAWDEIHFTEAIQTMLTHVDIFYFGSLVQRSPISKATLQQCLCKLPATCLKIFDVNLRPPCVSLDPIVQSLKICDVLKLNHEELSALTNMLTLDGTTREKILELRKRFDIAIIALTLGEDGSLLCGADELFHISPASSIQVLDTVGAGDAFAAALAIGLAQHKTPQQLHPLANAIGGHVCSQDGAMVALPPTLLEPFKF